MRRDEPGEGRGLASSNTFIIRRLDLQYRMSGSICRWASDAVYQGRLKAGTPAVESRCLKDLGVEEGGEDVCILIDTEGGMNESGIPGGGYYTLQRRGGEVGAGCCEGST